MKKKVKLSSSCYSSQSERGFAGKRLDDPSLPKSRYTNREAILPFPELAELPPFTEVEPDKVQCKEM